MWLMLQKPESSDYVVATGEGATVKDFARAAFAHAGLDWEKYVAIDRKYERPTEVDALIGDPSKAERELNWVAKTHWEDLAKLMVDFDLSRET
jgi:GDPmannose 4,6-dehydratase